MQSKHRGMEQLVARWAHNPKVAGSSPAPATLKVRPLQINSVTAFSFGILIISCECQDFEPSQFAARRIQQVWSMEKLFAYLLQFGHVNAQQFELIRARAKHKKIAKGAYFAEAGKVSAQIGYITDGIFRVCYYDKAGDSFTRYFVYENRFVVDVNSFRDEIPSAEYIEAITDCQLLVFSKQDFTQLSALIPGWDDLFVKITSYVLENKLKVTSNMLVQDAQKRYLNFLDHYPGLANRVPLHMLASYLGITPSSLSRIRKSIH